MPAESSRSMPDIRRAQDRLEPVEDALSGLLDLLAGHDNSSQVNANGLFALLYPINHAVREANDLLRQK